MMTLIPYKLVHFMTVMSMEWTTTDTTRCERGLGIQYKHESKEDIAGFISKPVARPEYGMIYQHKGMLLQNLHRRYLYILIKLPNLLNLEQIIPDFPNCDNYGSLSANNPDPMLDDTPTNDNELHQVICNTFKIAYFQKWISLSS